MNQKIRPLSSDELMILLSWEQADNVNAYIRARILQLSQKEWPYEEIATAMGVTAAMVQELIREFNQGGVAAIAPRPQF